MSSFSMGDTPDESDISVDILRLSSQYSSVMVSQQNPPAPSPSLSAASAMLRPGSGNDFGGRPGTSSRGNMRPSTSSGRRNLTQTSGMAINQGPDSVFSADAGSILQSELGNDELLRIMSAPTVERTNAVMLSAESGDLVTLRALIGRDSSVIAMRGLHGYTALHHASNRGHALVVADLLKHSIDINVRNDAGETPLHLAVYSGNILIVDQLLDKGADLDASNSDGETCLFYAARRNHPAIIRLLLQRGANVNHQDNFGDSAVDQATERSALRVFEAHSTGDTPPLEEALSAGASAKQLTHTDMLLIYSFLTVTDVMRCACVSSKWHRVSEYECVWQRLGVRRWELALQSSLGFAPSATSSFFRPMRSSSFSAKERTGSNKSSRNNRASNAQSREEKDSNISKGGFS